MNLEDLHLVLFLSRSTPLQRWKQLGILERELTYYESLAARIRKLSIVSSGDENEVGLIPNNKNIEILYNRWKLPANIYSLCSPFLHYLKLSSCNLCKTNQLDGAWTAIISGYLIKKKVILRAGYLWAEFAHKEGVGKLKTKIISYLQSSSFKHADYVYLPTKTDKTYVSKKYNILPQQIFVIPNYVDTDSFKPITKIRKKPRSIIYIGRLHERKNLISLIEASSSIENIDLIFFGDGPQRETLEKIAQKLHIDVKFHGIIPHNQIPVELNHADIFILPSLFEGHPKSLIEAMACGMPVIGTNVPGIREIIKHGETGWLCETDPNSLAEAIDYVIGNRELKKKMGRNARNFVLENYTLEKVLKLEIDAIQTILNIQ